MSFESLLGQSASNRRKSSITGTSFSRCFTISPRREGKLCEMMGHLFSWMLTFCSAIDKIAYGTSFDVCMVFAKLGPTTTIRGSYTIRKNCFCCRDLNDTSL